MIRRTFHPIVTLALAAVASTLWGIAPPARGEGAPVDCARSGQALQQSEAPDRVALAASILERACRPIPTAIVSALQTGVWWDGTALAPADRLSLLARATRSAYAEAETLAVALLENGRWPAGAEIHVEDGARIIAALAPVLTPYRTRLLLDVYEQQAAPQVRLAVVQALRGSAVPEAILAALDASFLEAGPLPAAAMAQLGTKEERDAALARLLRDLPAGPAREWAQRLASARGPGPRR